ncbi:ketosteroid isomerase-like protein [Microvirga flocculans]|uniref:Ketosteroid isomerase-like protein n=1 Tax=Microvirga flocculans TaxID=217168 RepID=A0A7W6IC28_9HYPH|nr:nuclear transport factor 2 family protein [Microvirga flocculans]MBB4038727.1 ketosteroid isomerase-like protein [Microvirga flocculans]
MMDNHDIEALERRLRAVEDRLSIYNLISAYGPAVDACSIENNAELWTEDSVYKVGGLGEYVGHQGLRDMIEGPFHQDVTNGGSGHVLSLPHVHLDGDRAVATNYAKLFAHRDGVFTLRRLVVSRWELERRDGQWKIRRRTNVLLDGSPEGKALLARTPEGLDASNT